MESQVKSSLELKLVKISREVIKPETPTPPHLKNFKFSLLDQLAPLIYTHHFLCYAPPAYYNKNNQPTILVARLRESLSRTLSLFYPVAGRLTAEESAIDCNDEGVVFVVAQINCDLSAFLRNPKRVDMITHLFPDIQCADENNVTVSEILPLALQVTLFACGGFILGNKLLHKFMDGYSAGFILRTWATFAVGSLDKVVRPDFSSGVSRFPACSWAAVSQPRKQPLRLCDIDRVTRHGTCVVNVFAFTPASISALQAHARSDHLSNPTRIEVVSACIWKYAMAAAKAVSSPHSRIIGPSVLTHAINVRPYTLPKITPRASGNIVIDAIAYYDGEDSDLPEISILAKKIGKAISAVKDGEFLNSFQGEEGSKVVHDYERKLESFKKDPNINTYKFTSWSKLGIVPDFGWGEPVWIGSIYGRLSSAFRNRVLLIEDSQDGFEAWVTLEEKEMDVLRTNSEFLAFASPKRALHASL